MKIKLVVGIVLVALLATVLGAKSTGLPWISDDYASALGEAKQRKLPIFVECWAPW